MQITHLNRRAFLGRGLLLSAVAGCSPKMAFATAPTERRFVFIIQRGAADGLAIVSPVGDPAYAPLRGALAAGPTGTKLDGMFSLHPELAATARLYAQGQALIAHAVASPYRDRSHFDGQNVLETGGATAYQVKDGWMNRMLGLVPKQDAEAIAVSATVPMALRGDREVGSYAPSALPDASDDLLQRVTALYQSDPQLHAIWDEAMQTRQLAGDLAEGGGRGGAATGTLAASLLKPANGARIAMIETGGWDTHRAQEGRLAANLKGLDALLASLQAGLGPVWQETMVVIATEFGRTAAVNGTGGTDHGTGTAAMILGGGVKGGRVIADWPGLRASDLYEGRDLKPTMQLDALIAGAVAQHFAVDPAQALHTLFPGAGNVRPIEGLVRA